MKTFQGFGVALLACMSSGGAFATDETTELAREMGSALGWRLGPEAIAEHCRTIDPDGVAAREIAVQKWRTDNEKLIRSVDERVSEVAPMINLKAPAGVLLDAIKRQVKDVVLESAFGDKTPEQVLAMCKADTNPASPHFSNGMPHVAMSLATLYDWKIAHSPKATN